MVHQVCLPTVAACIKRPGGSYFSQLIRVIINAWQCTAVCLSLRQHHGGKGMNAEAKEPSLFHLEALTWHAKGSGMISHLHQQAQWPACQSQWVLTAKGMTVCMLAEPGSMWCMCCTEPRLDGHCAKMPNKRICLDPEPSQVCSLLGQPL